MFETSIALQVESDSRGILFDSIKPSSVNINNSATYLLFKNRKVGIISKFRSMISVIA